MDLTEEEVLQILNLIEKSSFDFFELQTGDLKLIVSKSGYTGNARAHAPMSESGARAEPASEARENEAAAKLEAPEAKQKAAVVREGTLPINAPIVGIFYITPEPGAPPFVETGSRVDEDTTVGLIEVMKVFNAVKSGVRGAVVEICVQSGQFVEYGQTLYLVRPDEGESSG